MAIIVPNPFPPPVVFHGDSSSRDNEFMVAGGFAVSGKRVAEIEANIATLRESANISEFHWSEYRGGDRRDAYHELVKYGYQLVRQGHAELHIIISRFKGYNHKRVAGENKDTSVNRMYWLLGLHRLADYYGHDRTIHMRLDHGNDSKDICNMRNELCAAAYNEYDTRPNCIRSITPVCSSKSGIVQMADVIVGGVAAKRNGVIHSPKTEKGPLADFIHKESGHTAWDRDTYKGARGLTVWNHKTGKKKKVPPSPI
ncbi:hypothetical protein [uncultured Erythrobacter sp.]|uniref:hypothetical protein n=1 Tax=uncultured Erythrobacter sp. TaxID=263913 RepID=UPI00262F8775|nr:hypothetical protein [uncultured Erythrobacter sp.]